MDLYNDDMNIDYQKCLVSFIIPAYNAEKTIVRCLDSIYSLPLEDSSYEVILIDDCSKDNTLAIVNQYSTKRINLIVLCQESNHRQGAARNKGLSVANGKYICFVDSDDVVVDGIVDALKLAETNNLEMTSFNFIHVDEHNNVLQDKKMLDFEDGQIFSGIELQSKYPFWCLAPWAYVYDKSFIEKVNYPFVEDVLYEDSDFVIIHLYNAQNMGYSNKCGYMVYNTIGSITREVTSHNLSDYLFLGMRMLDFYSNITRNNKAQDFQIENKKEKFIDSVLDGACYNISTSFRKLFRLNSLREIIEFYDRIDRTHSREILLKDERIRKYYWNSWTWCCLRLKTISIIIARIVSHKIASKILIQLKK